MRKTSGEELLDSLSALREADLKDVNSQKVKRFLLNTRKHFESLNVLEFDSLLLATKLLNSMPNKNGYYDSDMMVKLDTLDKLVTKSRRNKPQNEQDAIALSTQRISELYSAIETKTAELQELDTLKVTYNIQIQLSRLTFNKPESQDLNEAINQGKEYLKDIKTQLYNNFKQIFDNASGIRAFIEKEDVEFAKVNEFEDNSGYFNESLEDFFEKAFPLQKKESIEFHSKIVKKLSEICQKNDYLTSNIKNLNDLSRNVEVINDWIKQAEIFQASNTPKEGLIMEQKNQALVDIMKHSRLLEPGTVPQKSLKEKLVSFFESMGRAIKYVVQNIQRLMEISMELKDQFNQLRAKSDANAESVHLRGNSMELKDQFNQLRARPDANSDESVHSTGHPDRDLNLT